MLRNFKNDKTFLSAEFQFTVIQFVKAISNKPFFLLEALNPGLKGRTIRKVMRGGGGVGKKPKKNSCKGKCQEKKFVQRRRERKKIHAEGRSNCDFYSMDEICQQTC